MDSFRILIDLYQLSKALPELASLKHFFKSFDPLASEPYRNTRQNFITQEQIVYRSANHELCDWLYGWDISEMSQVNLVREPRVIDMSLESEKETCLALLKTYQTLFLIQKQEFASIYLAYESGAYKNKVDEEEKKEEEEQLDGTVTILSPLDEAMNYVEITTEKTLLATATLMVIILLSEILQDKETFAKHVVLARQLGLDFMSNECKWTWDNCRSLLTFETLRQPELLKYALSSYRFKFVADKFSVLSQMLTIFDVYLFPKFILSHKEGVKAASPSMYGSNIWLTGGYDGLVKITDIRNNQVMALFADHKSIVTDCHFMKNDAYMVSSSFDRTIKIWNTKNGTVEKTMTGHNDAITCCHVSADGRYIVSGSMDNTFKVWDGTTGSLLATVKKHFKWVKSVRISPDGRFIATAGLDARVLIWETRMVIKGDTTPFRTLEGFADYVLDMDMHENFLLTSTRDGVVRVTDIVTGQDTAKVSLVPSWACTVTFAPGGQFFATGSFDNNINIYRLDGTKVREMRLFSLGIMTLSFPQDYEFLAVGTAEGFLVQIPL